MFHGFARDNLAERNLHILEDEVTGCFTHCEVLLVRDLLSVMYTLCLFVYKSWHITNLFACLILPFSNHVLLAVMNRALLVRIRNYIFFVCIREKLTGLMVVMVYYLSCALPFWLEVYNKEVIGFVWILALWGSDERIFYKRIYWFIIVKRT